MTLQEFLTHLSEQDGMIIDVDKHVEGLDATVDSLTSSVELILGVLTRQPPTADGLKALEKNDMYTLLHRVTSLPKGVQMFGAIGDVVVSIGNACHYLIDELPSSVVAESATAREGTMLFALSAMISTIDALSRYVNDMFADVTQTPKFQVSAMIKLLQRDMMSTAQIINALSKGSDNLLDNIATVPDLQISGDVAKRAGSSVKRLGIISLRWNPLFVARMLLAQRRIRKLKMLLEEKRLIEARIAMYLEQANGTLTPAAEKAVKYYQEVVTKMTAEIERIS